MITTLLAFFGGNAFRMIFGEAVAFLQRRQENAAELERMRLSGQLASEQHARQMATIEAQRAAGVQMIEVQTASDVTRGEVGAWASAVDAVGRLTGIPWVDVWNRCINPAVATWAVGMITAHYAGLVQLDDNGWAIAGAALGVYLADRNLFKRGK